MNSRAHIFVRGRVQGVFFRDHTRKWASSLGLTGWVRNVADGRVEVTVEGDQKRIERLIAHLEDGPPLSHVEDVQVNWEDHRGEFDDFKITWAGY
jgi:acylphosphatase